MAREGDFEGFVRATSPRLMTLARLLTGDAGMAEDLVQDAYARTYLRWERIEVDPERYVRRCVVNGYTDWWRRRPWREQPTATVPDLPDGRDQTGRYDERAAVTAALATLTRRERAVLVLRYYDDLSEAQIAEVLQVAPGTVKSTATRALRKLRHNPHLTPAGQNSDEPTQEVRR